MVSSRMQDKHFITFKTCQLNSPVFGAYTETWILPAENTIPIMESEKTQIKCEHKHVYKCKLIHMWSSSRPEEINQQGERQREKVDKKGNGDAKLNEKNAV